jgi:hypothetical protein
MSNNEVRKPSNLEMAIETAEYGTRKVNPLVRISYFVDRGRDAGLYCKRVRSFLLIGAKITFLPVQSINALFFICVNLRHLRITIF